MCDRLRCNTASRCCVNMTVSLSTMLAFNPCTAPNRAAAAATSWLGHSAMRSDRPAHKFTSTYRSGASGAAGGAPPAAAAAAATAAVVCPAGVRCGTVNGAGLAPAVKGAG